jgi:hypothetical protein
VGLDLQFISSGVAARSLQDALIWLSGLTPKKTLELPTKDYQPLAHFHAGSALDCVKKIIARRKMAVSIFHAYDKDSLDRVADRQV